MFWLVKSLDEFRLCLRPKDENPKASFRAPLKSKDEAGPATQTVNAEGIARPKVQFDSLPTFFESIWVRPAIIWTKDLFSACSLANLCHCALLVPTSPHGTCQLWVDYTKHPHFLPVSETPHSIARHERNRTCPLVIPSGHCELCSFLMVPPLHSPSMQHPNRCCGFSPTDPVAWLQFSS